nr:hypothetical protein [Bradyrhizobium sp.]
LMKSGSQAMRSGYSYHVSPANNAPIPACAFCDLTLRKWHYQTGRPSPVNCRPSQLQASSCSPGPLMTNRDKAPSHDKRRGQARDPERATAIRARSSMKAEANGHQASIRRCGNVTDLTLDAGCRPRPVAKYCGSS